MQDLNPTIFLGGSDSPGFACPGRGCSATRWSRSIFKSSAPRQLKGMEQKTFF